MNSIEGKDGWYSIDIAAEDLTGYNIIFNNGSGEQTADIALQNGLVYFYGLTGQGYTSEEAALEDASKVVEAAKLYLKPNSNWTQSNARFAAYFFGAGEKWVSMTDDDSDGIYEVEIPEGGYTSVIFCRMNPSTTENNWNNKWNQTGDLKIPTDDKVLFTVPSGSWDSATTGWSTKE